MLETTAQCVRDKDCFLFMFFSLILRKLLLSPPLFLALVGNIVDYTKMNKNKTRHYSRDYSPFAKMMSKEQSQTQEQTNQEERQISDSLSESKKHETNKKISKKTVRQN